MGLAPLHAFLLLFLPIDQAKQSARIAGFPQLAVDSKTGARLLGPPPFVLQGLSRSNERRQRGSTQELQRNPM